MNQFCLSSLAALDDPHLVDLRKNLQLEMVEGLKEFQNKSQVNCGIITDIGFSSHISLYYFADICKMEKEKVDRWMQLSLRGFHLTKITREIDFLSCTIPQVDSVVFGSKSLDLNYTPLQGDLSLPINIQEENRKMKLSFGLNETVVKKQQYLENDYKTVAGEFYFFQGDSID